jgi:hypothetical protein
MGGGGFVFLGGNFVFKGIFAYFEINTRLSRIILQFLPRISSLVIFSLA